MGFFYNSINLLINLTRIIARHRMTKSKKALKIGFEKFKSA